MKLEIVAVIFTGCLLLLASSCSGNSESADFTDVGGTDSGGSVGSAQAGKNPSGGSSAGGRAGSGGGAQAGSGAGAMATAGSAGSSGQCSAGCIELCEGGACSCSCNANCEGFAAPALDKSCATDDDCFAGVHTLDCCGSQVVLGYSVSAQSSFNGYETGCRARAVCRCAPDDPTIEGGQVTSDLELRKAVCSAGHCLGTGPVHVGSSP
jgi:hypothetical protein